MNAKIEYRYLLFFLIIPFGFSLYCLINSHPISSDGIQYSDLGYNLIYKGVYDSVQGVIPGWIQPPVLPVLCGIFSVIFTIQYAGYIVGILSGILLLFLIFRFLKENFNIRVAYFAVLLLAINPLFVVTNLRVLAEPIYTIFNLLLFSMVYKIYQNKENMSYKEAIWLSVLTVLLYLSRPEGIFYFLLILLMLLSLRKIKFASIYLLLSILLLIPYGLFTQSQCGKFNLFPKFTYSLRAGVIGKVLQYEASADREKNEEFMRNVWFAYDNKNKTTFGTNLLNEAYFNELKNRINHEQPLQNKLKFLLSRIINNLIEIGRVVFRSYTFPILYLIFFIIGFFTVFRKNRRLFYLLWIWMLPASYFILSHVEERFLYAILPYMTIFISFGVSASLKKLTQRNGILVIIFTLIVLNSLLYYHEFYQYQKINNNYYKIARNLNKKIEKGSMICIKPFYITFFGNYNYLKLPICQPHELQEYMDINMANYLILGKEVESSHHDLISIYNNEMDSFQLLESIEMDNKTYKLFSVCP